MQLGTKPKLPQRCRKWGLFIMAPRRISTIRDNRKFVMSNYGPNEVSRRNRSDIGQPSCRTPACNWHCQMKGSDQPSGSVSRLFIRNLILHDQLKKNHRRFLVYSKKMIQNRVAQCRVEQNKQNRIKQNMEQNRTEQNVIEQNRIQNRIEMCIIEHNKQNKTKQNRIQA